MPQLTVEPAKHGEWSLYGGRFVAHVPAVATVTPTADDRDPLDVRVILTIDIVNGRLACTTLTAERLDKNAPVITGDGLRRIPVASYVEQAALKGGVLKERVRLNPHMDELIDFQPPPADFLKDGMTDEALDHIARIYAATQATGGRPSGVLLTEYGMPRATSSRWLSVARRRGILVEEHHQVMRESDSGRGGGINPDARAELDRIDRQLRGEGLPIGPPPGRGSGSRG